jgi:hypothetical protein
MPLVAAFGLRDHHPGDQLATPQKGPFDACLILESASFLAVRKEAKANTHRERSNTRTVFVHEGDISPKSRCFLNDK